MNAQFKMNIFLPHHGNLSLQKTEPTVGKPQPIKIQNYAAQSQ